jgi:hypothetical protein
MPDEKEGFRNTKPEEEGGSGGLSPEVPGCKVVCPIACFRLYGIRAVICLLLSVSLMLETTMSRADDRVVVDPNKEFVLVTIGGVNFDIPLGYLYEKTIWTNGAWPKPKKLRTVDQGIVLVAHINGLRPWSPALDSDFKSGGVQITRIHIRGDYNPHWLENWINSIQSLKVANTTLKAPGLTPFAEGPAARSIYLLV